MSHFKFKYLVLIAFVLPVFLSCNKTDDQQPDFKYEYFPVDSGHTVIYDVDSIYVDDVYQPPKIDTYYFQIMEVIGDTFIDGEGDIAFEIARYRRPDASSSWITQRRWAAKRTTTVAEKVEENDRYIKLIFPPKPEETWSGNAYFEKTEDKEYLDDWEYSITELDVPKTINELSFDSTLTVLQHDEADLIEKIYSEEIYAKHVGLVYKELIWLRSKEIDPEIGSDWSNTKKWTKSPSFIIRMKISSYSQ